MNCVELSPVVAEVLFGAEPGNDEEAPFQDTSFLP